MSAETSITTVVSPSAFSSGSTSGVLTREAAAESLSQLSHNRDGEIVLVWSNLAERGLLDVSALQSFPFLQRVTLDHNCLTSLAPLAHLSNLVTISATHNELTESVFGEIQSSAVSLERLFLDHNKITSLDGLQNFPFLVDVSVAGNQITGLQAAHFRGLTGLLQLNVSNNAVATVEPDTFAEACNVRVLDLSHNHIEELHYVTTLRENLEVLSLSHNRLSTLGPELSFCQALSTLDISFNKLICLSDFRALCPAPRLHFLTISSNPLSDTSCILQDVLNRFENVGGEEEPAASSGADGLKECQSAEEAKEKLTYFTDFASLAAPQAVGLLRRVMVSKPISKVPWTVNLSEELARLPLSVQLHLWLLSLFPQLLELDGAPVRPESTAQSVFFFGSPAHK